MVVAIEEKLTQKDKETLCARLRLYRHSALSFVCEVIGADPTEQQQELLESVSMPGSKTSVTSGHGPGKSTVLAWIILWAVSCFPNCKVPCTAPSGHQLEDVLWAELAKWHQQMHGAWRRKIVVGSKKVYHVDAKETQFAVARTARPENPDALQGFHADNLFFLVDEAAGVAQQVFEVAEGALSTKNSRVVMTANPTQTSGYFYDSHHRHRDLWKRLRFSCLDSPLVDEEYVTSMKKKWGEDSDIYRVRVLGKFPRASIVQLISTALVEEAGQRKLHRSKYDFAPKILGVDVAWEGDDRSVVYMRQGLCSTLLGVWPQIDTMTLAGIVAQFEDKYKTDATFVDVGWGTGVIDRLRQLGRNPLPVNFGGSAIQERFYNKRAEMWVLMKEWLEDGGVLLREGEEHAEDLYADLTVAEYGQSPKGKIALESKKEIKKRGLPSPDMADALALTFAQPVIKRSRMEQAAGKAPVAQTDYNVLG